MNDWRQIRTWSREEMMKRIARFKKLKGSDGGLPDSPLPECRRKLYAVIGFQPPLDRASSAATSPVGEDASSMPAIAIAEGFNRGDCKPQAEFTSAAMRRCEEYAAKQRATSPARGQRKQRRAAGSARQAPSRAARDDPAHSARRRRRAHPAET